MVAVEETALVVTDTRGPVLSGAYTSQSDWRRVIAELGTNAAGASRNGPN